MQGILYEESSVWLFLLVTVAMGGWAAWRTGKATARMWKPSWMLVPYMLLLGMAVRFIHFAMFEGTLFSLRYYLVDTAVILVFAWLGWRYERTVAMARQYAFAFEKASALSWRRKGA
jgi:small-conductance mechanosensitive channel